MGKRKRVSRNEVYAKEKSKIKSNGGAMDQVH